MQCPDEKSKKQKAAQWIIRSFNVCAILVLLLWGSYAVLERVGYMFHWGQVINHLEVFNKALVMTLKLSLIAFALAILFGLLLALARLSKFRLLADFAHLYVEVFRNIPLLVVIAIFNWGLGGAFPQISLFFWSALALSIFEASYIGEIFRGGIEAIPKEQVEAAHSLGLSFFQVMRYIVIPQALQAILPALTGQIVTLVKDSSLASIVGLFELTLAARTIVGSTFAPLEAYAVGTLYYFAVCYPISLLSSYLERHLNRGLVQTG
jgi:polar amino acid transport system permease protein